MLDFQKRKKRYFDITLHDGTKLQIPTPTIAIFNAMKVVTGKLDDASEIAKLTSLILHTNKQGVKITEKHIEEFDFDDMKEFFIEYTKFVQEALSDPNLKSPIAQ